MTINQLLVLIKAVRSRANELNALRTQVSTEDHFYGAKERVVEPKYDVIKVDIKCVELEKFLFVADAAIKQSNALTEVAIDANVDSLLAPLE